MRIFVTSFFILLSVCSSVVASVGQASRSISLSLNKVSLDEALRILEEKSGVHFDYNSNLIHTFSYEHFEAKNRSWQQILGQLLASTPLTFTPSGENGPILIFRKRSNPDRVIRGHIVNGSTGEALAGVTIKEKSGTGGAISDANGNFAITLRGANAVLVISYIGYLSQEITVGTNASVNVRLKESSRSLNEVVVQARRRIDNEVTLLNERKNAAVVSDGISARQIEKTASITTAQALQRVSGVTITDDKYVAIRGLGERAVIAELNGARLSSANPDRSSVPLDLVPAALLDNITVYKTLTPDRPADASAGIVELKTKSIPDSLSISFVVQGGFNSTIGLGGKVNSFTNGDPGFFGQRIKDHDLSPAFINLQKQYPGTQPGQTNIQIQRLFIERGNSPQLTAEANRVNNIMQSFDPVLTTRYAPATANQIYTASFGNTFFHRHLGVIVSGNYYRRFEDRYKAELNQYSLYQGVVTGSRDIFSPLHIPGFITPDHIQLGKFLSFKENRGLQTINYGFLTGLSYRFNARNEISAQYLGSRGGEIQGSNLMGSWQNTGQLFAVYNTVYGLRQTYRIFNTLNFQGEHKLFNKYWAPQISYNLSSSKSIQDEPDYRTIDIAQKTTVKFLDLNGISTGTSIYREVIGQVSGINTIPIIADPNARSYRNLNENNYNFKGDFTQPFLVGKLKEQFKFGFNYLRRDRTFIENLIGLPGSRLGGDNGLLDAVGGNPDLLVSYKNIALGSPSTINYEGQPTPGGFLYQSAKSPNNYKGFYLTRAFYGMLDLHVLSNLRIIGGVRYESTDIKASVDNANVFTNQLNIIPGPRDTILKISPNTAYHSTYKPYYSFNLVYTYRKNVNFRLAYNTSLARPEIRELTNIYEFDPFQFAVITGNQNLVNQFTRSADFRWEWFPSPGEVISASAFGKKIYKQLTRTFSLSSAGTAASAPEFPAIKFVNDPEVGTVYGLEFEIRKNLRLLSSRLKNFYLGANVLIANSEIKKNSARLLASRTIDRASPTTSPVFEQAPYSINSYLDYDNRKTGTNATVSFNIVGERLIQVQVDGTPDIYSRPVPIFDFVFSQSVFKRFVVKGFVKNLLNPTYRDLYESPRSNGTFYGQTYVNHAFYRGTEVSLGITYNLF